MSIRTFFVSVCALFAAAMLLQSQQNQPPPAEGTRNAPAPAGAAQDNRAPNRRAVLQAGAGGGGYPQYDADAVQRGQEIFQANCQFCHGANAKGGEGGPDLLRSVLVLHDEKGNEIGPVIRNGRPDKGMPKFPLSEQQIDDISVFLHQKVKDAALRGTYQILNIVTGDPAKGEAYFNGDGHCSNCHSVTGDLEHIGSHLDPVDIQQKIVMPRTGGGGRRRNTGPVPPKQRITATVTLPNGQTVEGAVAHIDDFNIALQVDNGGFRSFTRNGDVPKVVLHDPLKAHVDMLKTYNDADIHNLTAYLVSLK